MAGPSWLQRSGSARELVSSSHSVAGPSRPLRSGSARELSSSSHSVAGPSWPQRSGSAWELVSSCLSAARSSLPHRSGSAREKVSSGHRLAGSSWPRGAGRARELSLRTSVWPAGAVSRRAGALPTPSGAHSFAIPLRPSRAPGTGPGPGSIPSPCRAESESWRLGVMAASVPLAIYQSPGRPDHGLGPVRQSGPAGAGAGGATRIPGRGGPDLQRRAASSWRRMTRRPV